MTCGILCPMGKWEWKFTCPDGESNCPGRWDGPFVSFEINLCVWALSLKTADFDSISVPFVDKNCILCYRGNLFVLSLLDNRTWKASQDAFGRNSTVVIGWKRRHHQSTSDSGSWKFAFRFISSIFIVFKCCYTFFLLDSKLEGLPCPAFRATLYMYAHVREHLTMKLPILLFYLSFLTHSLIIFMSSLESSQLASIFDSLNS